MKALNLILRASSLGVAITLAACGGDNDDKKETVSVYEITLTNATANQPIAPSAVILHDADYSGWEVGSPASIGLETLAESGSPSLFLEEATNALDTEASNGILMPGTHSTVTVSAVWRDDLSLTIAGMPVNTNDAFSGATGWRISNLEIGESSDALLNIYDAGTEANTESAATMPGPAANGEGFNAVRDDLIDAVSLHHSVVTSDDGFVESVLDESHRFDQGALYVKVTRTE